MNIPLSRRNFLTALGALGGLVGFDLSTAWARPILLGRQTDRSLANAIDLSIRNVAREGLNNFFPAPFEISMLSERSDLRQAVFTRAYAMLDTKGFRPSDFANLDLMEFPKREYGARRICAVMEPMDAVAYLALVLLAAPAIERIRIGADQRVVHSFRYRPTAMGGTLFDRRYNYVSFLKEARRRRGASDVLVACDIANFFGSVSPQAVHAALTEAAVPSATADHIASLLQFWLDQGAVGLPVGPNASKILAEAVLCRVDRSLQAECVEFVRYVDDFRLIARDVPTAENHARILADVLAANNLALNSEKTRMTEPKGAAADPIVTSANYEQAAPPRQFKPPTRQELRRLHKKRSDAAPDPRIFLTGPLLPTTKVRRTMRLAICTGQSDFIRTIPAILDRYPEFSRYATLALAYAADLVPQSLKRELGRYAATAVLDDRTPSFARLDFLRFIGEPGFVRRKTLINYALASEPRGPEFRAALDALSNCGGIPASILRKYEAADPRARRALAASARNRMRIPTNDDPFLSIIA